MRVSDATVADGVIVGEVDEEVTEEVVVDVVAGEVVVDEVDTEMVHPNIVVVDLISYVTTDTEVTAPSIEPFVHTDYGFSRGSIDRSMLIEYVDQMALRLWQGEVYVSYNSRLFYLFHTHYCFLLFYHFHIRYI